MMADLAKITAERAGVERKFERSVVDLQGCTWRPAGKDAEASILSYTDSGKTTEYRLSPLAFKQMSNRIVGGLYPIAMKNPPSLNEELYKTWLPLTDEKKKIVTLKHEGGYVRGVLGIEQSDVDASQMYKAVAVALQGLRYDTLQIAGKDEEFPTYQWLRIILSDKAVQQGTPDSYHFMVDVRCSDYAEGKMELEFGIFRDASGTGILARVAAKPYFQNPYKGIQGKDLEAMAKSAASRLDEQLKNFEDIMRRAEQQQLSDADIADMVKRLPRDRETSKGLMLKVVGEIDKQRPKTLLDVVNIVTGAVNDEKHNGRRIQHEAFAGSLMGLQFLPQKK